MKKDSNDNIKKVNLIDEGEVKFKYVIFVKKNKKSESLKKYGRKNEKIKMYVRRVFIKDELNEMMKK
jgi:HSP90 family molecular chaperone